jgi:hypothetical protein
MERVRSRGCTIVPKLWGVGYDSERSKWNPRSDAGRCMCPLGALVLCEQPPPGLMTVPEAARRVLGVSGNWTLCFTWAFDGGPPCLSTSGCEACALGQRLREEFLATENSP